jgi:hypothetical protein
MRMLLGIVLLLVPQGCCQPSTALGTGMNACLSFGLTALTSCTQAGIDREAAAAPQVCAYTRVITVTVTVITLQADADGYTSSTAEAATLLAFVRCMGKMPSCLCINRYCLRPILGPAYDCTVLHSLWLSTVAQFDPAAHTSTVGAVHL